MHLPFSSSFGHSVNLVLPSVPQLSLAATLESSDLHQPSSKHDRHLKGAGLVSAICIICIVARSSARTPRGFGSFCCVHLGRVRKAELPLANSTFRTLQALLPVDHGCLWGNADRQKQCDNREHPTLNQPNRPLLFLAAPGSKKSKVRTSPAAPLREK